MDIDQLLALVDQLVEEGKTLDKEELIKLLKELRQACVHFKEQATVDFLTGLYNRRFFEKQLETAIERAKREKVPFSLIILDLDFFKRINDQYGHVTGDQVLQQLARLIKKNIRKIDIAARYGGEEFAVILPSTGLEGAVSAARRLKRSIENHNFGLPTKPIKLTASFGVGTYSPFANWSATEFLDHVDHLLYLAKKRGRNCIVHEDIAIQKSLDLEGLSSEEKRALLNGVWDHDD